MQNLYRQRVPEFEAEQLRHKAQCWPADATRFAAPLEDGSIGVVQIGRVWAKVWEGWWILRRSGTPIRVASNRAFRANYEPTRATLETV